MTLATRIGVMNQGEIAMMGEPTDIYEFPNSRFVAGFIGSANMVEGVVTEDEPDHVAHPLGGTGLPTSMSATASIARPTRSCGGPFAPKKSSLSRESHRQAHPHRRQCHQACRGHRLPRRYHRSIRSARKQQDASGSARPIRVRGNPDAITWDETGLGHLEPTARRLGADSMTTTHSPPSAATAMPPGTRSSMPPRRGRPFAAASLVLAAPVLWLTIFFLIPLAVVFGISLATKQFGRPPYSPLLTTEKGTVQLTLHLTNYIRLFTDHLYIAAYLTSIRIAFISTVITLLLSAIRWPMPLRALRTGGATSC